MPLWTTGFVLLALASHALGSSNAAPPKGMEGRVVGGVTSAANQFPYLISIRNINKVKEKHFCGGSLIRANLVLTAAHCFFDSRTTMPIGGTALRLTAGEHSLKGHEGTEQVGEVKTLVIHSGYDPKRYGLNDIALVELSSPFVLNSVVKIIKMAATTGDKTRSTNCTIAGWGVTKQMTKADQQNPHFVMDKDGIPDTPSFVSQGILKKEDCDKLHPGYAELTSYPGTLCVGGEAGKGSCAGDSGGPLVCAPSEGGASEPLLVGIVSAGSGCAIKDRPTIFTSVAFWGSWIKKAEAALTNNKAKAGEGDGRILV